MVGVPAFFIGTTALSAYSRGLSVVSNNIANINTAGFKRSQVMFEDILADFRFDNVFGTGRGVNIAKVVNEFSQGSFENTQTDTDLGIAGNGFFMVKKTTGGNGIFYTRAGQFRFDKSGYLLDTNGYRLQGFGVDNTTGKSTGVSSDIRIDKFELPPKQTSEVQVGVNLDSTAAISGFNVVNGENDRFQVIVGYPSSEYKVVQAQITPGAYSGSELAAELETAIEAAVSGTGMVQDYSVSYDGDEGRFKIVLNSTTASGFNIDITAGVNNLVSFNAGTAATAGLLSLAAGSYKASDLASHLETRLQNQVGGAWSVTFDGTSGKYSVTLDSLPSGSTSVRLGWAAARTNSEGVFGFTANGSFTTGTIDTSDLGPYNSVEFQTYRTTIETSLNSGIVISNGTTRRRVEIAQGTYTPTQLAAALQAAINGTAGTPPPGPAFSGAEQVRVIYDQGSGEFVFRNPGANTSSLIIDWNMNSVNGGSILKTDEMLPALFGFSKTSSTDLSLAPGTVARSSLSGAFAAGRAYEFSRLIGFVSDTDGGPRVVSLAAGSTTNGLLDDIDTGQSRISDEVAGRFDPRNAANTANFSSSVVVYDSLGNDRTVELHFRKDVRQTTTDANNGQSVQVTNWEWFAGVAQGEVSRFNVTENNRKLVFAVEGGEAANETFSSGDSFKAAQLSVGTYTAEQLAKHLQDKLLEADSSANVTVSYSSTTGKFTISNNSTSQPIAFDFDGVQTDSSGNRTSDGFADLFGFNRTDSNNGTPDTALSFANTTVLLPAASAGKTPAGSNAITSEFAVGTGLEIEAAGLLRFDENGKLFNVVTPEKDETTAIGMSKYGFLDGLFSDYTDFDFKSGSQPDQNIKFNFGTPTQQGGTGQNLSTQFNAESIVNSMSQDGFAPGTLLRIAVDRSGTVNGLYTNGQTFAIARVGLANFMNPWGLGTLGNNLWSQTFESGAPIVNDPGTGVAGTIQSKALELSNVDMATEFVQLLRNQRGFQANTRVVTTADGLLQEILSIVR